MLWAPGLKRLVRKFPTGARARLSIQERVKTANELTALALSVLYTWSFRNMLVLLLLFVQHGDTYAQCLQGCPRTACRRAKPWLPHCVEHCQVFVGNGLHPYLALNQHGRRHGNLTQLELATRSGLDQRLANRRTKTRWPWRYNV